MSHAAHAHDAALLAPDNVQPGAGAARGVGALLIAAGAAAVAAVAYTGFTGDAAAQKHAMFSYHVGFMACVALVCGSLAFVMALHQTGAGWSAVIRRTFENIASGAPLLLLMFIPTAALCFTKPGLLWAWMDSAHVAGDLIYQRKQPFLNLPFFMIRAVVYFAVWIGLAAALRGMSVAQDRDGDKWRTRRLRKLSAPGLILFSLATAFAAFDWMMSLDYHFFSTMWGVYFFAIGMLSTLALGTLFLLLQRSAGRLRGVVTGEHFHDLGKLLFGFTVFWGYIAFSQYFLIWYANIPEETAYLLTRRTEGWLSVSTALAVGKFVIPFLVLLPRPSRRSPFVLTLACLWILTMTLVDLFWIIRPEMAKQVAPQLTVTWIDIAGAIGPVLVLIGFVAMRTAGAALVPLKDPRLPLSLHHKNHI